MSASCQPWLWVISDIVGSIKASTLWGPRGIFIPYFQMQLKQLKAVKFVWNHSICHWLYIEKAGFDIYASVSLSNWEEFSVWRLPTKLKFDFLIK